MTDDERLARVALPRAVGRVESDRCEGNQGPDTDTERALVIWPAPGFPALLNPGQQSFTAIVAARDLPAETARRWAETLSLRPSGGGETIAMAVDSVRPMEQGEAAELAGDFLALPQTQRLRVFQVRLTPSRQPAVAPGRSVQLFDLAAGGRTCRSRSVAFFPRQSNCLRLAFACDLHVAQFWEQIGEAADRHLPNATQALIRPHRLLKSFIDEANQLVDRGELDLVVLGGDLVDHVYPGDRQGDGTSPGGNNVERLVEMLGSLSAPTLAIPGNHDYRGYPWRPSLYGLGVIGLSREQTGRLLQKSGLRDAWPLRRQDLDALRTTDAAGRPAIREHLAHLSPALNFACTLHGVRLILLSTGRDALPQWRQMERRRWPMLLRGLRWAWQDPDSEGFDQRQLQRVDQWLQGAPGAELFFHAPLLASGRTAIEQRLERLELGPPESPAETLAWERRLQDAGVRCGVSLCGAGQLLHAMRAFRAPLAAFSGHLHAATAVQWQPTASRLQSFDGMRDCGRDGAIPLLTAPALGQVKPAVGHPPGYLLARFLNGKLTSLERRILKNPTDSSCP